MWRRVDTLVFRHYSGKQRRSKIDKSVKLWKGYAVEQIGKVFKTHLRCLPKSFFRSFHYDFICAEFRTSSDMKEDPRLGYQKQQVRHNTEAQETTKEAVRSGKSQTRIKFYQYPLKLFKLGRLRKILNIVSPICNNNDSLPFELFSENQIHLGDLRFILMEIKRLERINIC